VGPTITSSICLALTAAREIDVKQLGRVHRFMFKSMYDARFLLDMIERVLSVNPALISQSLKEDLIAELDQQ